MDGWLKKDDAFSFITNKLHKFDLDIKTLENWASSGQEIQTIKVKNRNGFLFDEIQNWVERLSTSIVTLNRDDYIKCFDFAVKSYYNPITKSDFNRAKQRDVGEFITNQVQGKLGELAVAELFRNYNLNIELDFNVNGQIPSQDISRINYRSNIWDNPSKKVSIKSTKLKNFLLPIPEKEASLADRKSDLYILSQVGLFSDHILRVIKSYGLNELKDCEKYIPDFKNIPCRIGGWISHDELIKFGLLSGEQIYEKYGIKMANSNYIATTGMLCYDWHKLINLLKQ